MKHAYQSFSLHLKGAAYSLSLLFFSSLMLQAQTNSAIFTAASSLDFDGLDDYVALPDSFANNFTNGMVSVTAWCYLDELSDGATIIKNWGNYTWGAFYFNVTAPSQELEIFIQEKTYSGRRVTSSDIFPLKQWVHVAFTADGDSLHLYQDGVKKGSKLYDGTLFTSFPATFIGVKPNTAGNGPGGYNPRYWDGKLDEMSIWNRGLSATDIQELATCRPSPNAAGLVAYYTFDQGLEDANNEADSILLDEVSASNHGILTNFSLEDSSSNWAAGNVLPICMVAAIEDYFEPETEMILAPNPVIDHLNVLLDVKKPTMAQMSIIDFSGRRAQSQSVQLMKGEQSFEIDVNQLSLGLYFLTIQIGKDHYSKKFIKIGE